MVYLPLSLLQKGISPVSGRIEGLLGVDSNPLFVSSCSFLEVGRLVGASDVVINPGPSGQSKTDVNECVVFFGGLGIGGWLTRRGRRVLRCISPNRELRGVA